MIRDWRSCWYDRPVRRSASRLRSFPLVELDPLAPGNLAAALDEPYYRIVGRAQRELPFGVGEIDQQIGTRLRPAIHSNSGRKLVPPPPAMAPGRTIGSHG